MVLLLLALAGPVAAAPHVVVIMTDDQRADTMLYMPKTRALLGDRGTTFANALASYPMCCPSRATFLTGQYAHNHGVLGNRWPNGGYYKLDHTNTLPVWLQAAGYHTAIVGKYLNEYDGAEIPPGWSSFQALVTNYYYGFDLMDNGTRRLYGAAEYQTDVLAELAVAQIRARPAGAPLFLFVAPYAPHSGSTSKALRASNPELTTPFLPPAPRHRELFTGLPCGPCAGRAFNERDVTDKPFQRAPLESDTTFGIAERWRASLRGLQAVDDMVEKIVHALTGEGLIDDTVILFTSDNGFFHGEHRITNGKFWPYDEALRVPLLIRGGGFPAGHGATQLVSNIDLAPTIVALTGATPGRMMDGRPLATLALDPTKGLGRTILLEGGAEEGAEEGDAPLAVSVSYRGLRTEREHYVRYTIPMIDNGVVVERIAEEFYVMGRDPQQGTNRINDPKFAGQINRLRRQLHLLETCAGTSCGAE